MGRARGARGGAVVLTVWQYKVFRLPNYACNLKSSVIEAQLNEIGAEGWELMSIDDGRLCFFKRKIGSHHGYRQEHEAG